MNRKQTWDGVLGLGTLFVAATLAAGVAACGGGQPTPDEAPSSNPTLDVEATAVAPAPLENVEMEIVEGSEAPIPELVQAVEDLSGPPQGELDPSAGQPCMATEDCGGSLRCDYSANQGCEPQPGVCSPQPPPMCTREYNPLCGCDGRTYGNPCEHAQSGVALAHQGPCAE